MLFELIIALLVFGALYWIVTTLIPVGLFRTIGLIILAVLAIVFLLGLIGVGPGLGF